MSFFDDFGDVAGISCVASEAYSSVISPTESFAMKGSQGQKSHWCSNRRLNVDGKRKLAAVYRRSNSKTIRLTAWR